jgi:hypothetical protein
MRALFLVAALALAASAEEKLDDAEAEMKKADDYAAKKDYVAALAHYNAARMIAPDKPGPYHKLGMTYVLTGDCKQAVPNLEQYVKLKGTDANPEAVLALSDCKAKLPAAAPPPSACNEGMVKSADTAGKCCWPGQVWAPGENRCVGEPVCPPGFTLGPKRKACHKSAGCPPGKVQSQVPGQCCWPGQGYSHEKKACIGDPICADGFVVVAGECKPDARPMALSKPQIANAMRAATPVWKGCAQQYRDHGQANAVFTVNGDGTVRAVHLEGPLARTSLGTCLEDALKSAVFPQFKGAPMTIRWPFSFK